MLQPTEKFAGLLDESAVAVTEDVKKPVPSNATRERKHEPGVSRSRSITLTIPDLTLPWGFVVACFGALLLVLGAYSNSLHNSFHFDDTYSIERNIFIRDLANIPRFFTDAGTFSSFPTNADYRPIVTLTLALDYRLGGGLNLIAFHITQLALLVAVGVLLFLVCAKLYDSAGASSWHRWLALFTATLFCVH